jgi:D-tyrosyl-tRNA(Tyr) deacylase
MRAVVQRVSRARVTVDRGRTPVGDIGPGLCVLVGVTHDDTPERAAKLADRIWNLRIMDDENGVMNRSVADTTRSVLLVSQFTLYGDTSRGRRPSWLAAAPPEVAEPLVEKVGDELRRLGADVATGRFRAEMAVELVNDGPVTILLEI